MSALEHKALTPATYATILWRHFQIRISGASIGVLLEWFAEQALGDYHRWIPDMTEGEFVDGHKEFLITFLQQAIQDGRLPL